MNSKTAIIIGGSGYIGRNLLRGLLSRNRFDHYVIFDLKPLVGFDDEIKSQKVEYIEADVRKSLPDLKKDYDADGSWIFNFAAIHREPGHEFREYFDTNIPGAKNVNEFAERHQIPHIFFTSSIAPYGKSYNESRESSALYPETGYGISKALSEKEHQKWLHSCSTAKRLIIVRPSVIYGPHDPGNVYRMIKALKKGTFILPNGGKVIKAYGYVYGLVDSMLFTIDSKTDPLIIYNYAEDPLVPLKEMTQIVKKEFGYTKPTLSVSTRLLAFVAVFIQAGCKLIGKKSEIHPVRVRKAGFPTNINPQYLKDNGFDFKYGFQKSLEHWKSIAPEDF